MATLGQKKAAAAAAMDGTPLLLPLLAVIGPMAVFMPELRRYWFSVAAVLLGCLNEVATSLVG